MEKIGKILKDRREALGLSVDDISVKTRLTSKHIHALEEGDISFFHEDLSYLRFFVKSYCDAVGVDFEEVKDELRNSVNEYTTSFATNMELNHKEIERNIANSERLSKVKTADVKVKKRRGFKRPDMSLVSLVAIVGVVAIVILFAFVVFLNSDANKKDNNAQKIPVAGDQQGNGDNKYPSTDEKEEEKEKEHVKELSITKDDVTRYTINNAEEGGELNINTMFNGSNTAFSITVDGKVLEQPQATIYKIGSKADAKITVKKGMKIQLYVGYMIQTAIKINDKNVAIDDTIINSGGSYTLEFTVGETNEPAK